MRTFLITIVALLSLSLSATAQNEKDKKNTIKYGYGTTFHSNDMVGNYQYGEYTRFLGNKFALSLLGGYLRSDNLSVKDRLNDYKFNAWKGDFNLYVLPFNSNNVSLKIGGGASGWTGDFQSRDSTEMDFMKSEEQDYGWNAAAELEVYAFNTLVIGARAAYTQALDVPTNNYYFFGLNAGLKF